MIIDKDLKDGDIQGTHTNIASTDNAGAWWFASLLLSSNFIIGGY